MMLPGKHRAYHDAQKFNYLLFDSIGHFNAFVAQEKLNQHNADVLKAMNRDTQSRLASNADWYGSPHAQTIKELDEHDRFLGMHLLKTLKPKIDKHLIKYLRYLDTEVMPKAKISYNDRGIGMFSFDRAAMGLFQTNKITLGSPIEKAAAQINIELGRDRIKTHIKKIYAYFESKNSVYPAIRIYLMAGANAKVEGDEMLYVGLGCAELTDFLEARGVPVELNVMIGSAHNEQVTIAAVRVKRFQDKVDKNLLLLLSSDPRYFRYRGFKALIALSNHFGLDIPKGLGRLEENMGNQFVKAVDARGFVFEQSYSLDHAAQEIKRIIETYWNTLNPSPT